MVTLVNARFGQLNTESTKKRFWFSIFFQNDELMMNRSKVKLSFVFTWLYLHFTHLKLLQCFVSGINYEYV